MRRRDCHGGRLHSHTARSAAIRRNILYIESVRTYSETLDNFIIDNVVVFFKTRVQTPGGIGEIGEIAPQ
jgi:hypothetical protein